MKTILKLGVLALASSLFVSCSGPGPLVTEPPAKVINVTQNFKWGDGLLLKQFSYPKGDYVAIKEDKRGWYFVAPQQVMVKDFPLTYGKGGGIYWKRDKQSPKHVYIDNKVGNSYATLKKNNIPYRIVK